MFEKRSRSFNDTTVSRKVFQILNQKLDREYTCREIDILMEEVINVITIRHRLRPRRGAQVINPITKKATIEIMTDGSWLCHFENDQFVRTNIKRSPYYAKGRFIPNATDIHFHFK
jgi:hypothetical protein